MGTFFTRLRVAEAPIYRPTRRSIRAQSLGVYRCGKCGLLLFTSHAQFAGGADWASFHAPVSQDHVQIIERRYLGLVRREIVCAGCGSHLGFLFDDGPKPRGLRFSVMLATLSFRSGKAEP